MPGSGMIPAGGLQVEYLTAELFEAHAGARTQLFRTHAVIKRLTNRLHATHRTSKGAIKSGQFRLISRG